MAWASHFITVDGYKRTWKENAHLFCFIELSYKRIIGLEPMLSDWKSNVLPNYTIFA
ncbi:hypothetical protein HOR11_gp026 [Lactobacillus phage SA-C12]|uniref:Uncharacterized protein n=1 Tax=Lactobacillus phage SA-C12 TaxID=1755697 RepID=A0A1I9KK75_9CAUD|nr:hypothetical protein HOR11_gp026 [Lactobacillus phage SA-C12]ALY06848.1 hypothetical protein SAC12_026 [Lactobacillus phage SA-C12]